MTSTPAAATWATWADSFGPGYFYFACLIELVSGTHWVHAAGYNRDYVHDCAWVSSLKTRPSAHAHLA